MISWVLEAFVQLVFEEFFAFFLWSFEFGMKLMVGWFDLIGSNECLNEEFET